MEYEIFPQSQHFLGQLMLIHQRAEIRILKRIKQLLNSGKEENHSIRAL